MGGIDPALAQLGQQMQPQPLPPPGSPVPPPPDISNLGIGQNQPPQQAQQPNPQQTPQQPDPIDGMKAQLAQRIQQLNPAPQSGGPIRRLLQNFFSGGGQAMMKHVGLPTPEEEQQNLTTQYIGLQNTQTNDQYRKALEAAQQMVPVTLPDGSQVQMPSSSAKTVYAAQARAQSQQALQNPMVSSDMAAAMGHPEWAGKPINTALAGMVNKQDIATQGNQTRTDIAGQANSTRLQLAQQSDTYKRWKENIDTQTKLRVASMTQSKAPAAMMQTATFAGSGLQLLNDAQTAFADLKQKGILGSVSSDKMENWIFGKGLVDPNLPPAARNEISQLRAALSYTSSAAMRAHTGRTSQEIYNDFKTTLGLGQGSDALEGAMTETGKMLGMYANSASDAAIQQLRGRAGINAPAAPATGVVKWGRDANGNPVRMP
jgi:hypothetical protein